PVRGKRECSPPNNGNDPVAHWNPPPATVIATGAVLPATKTTIPQICGLCCSVATSQQLRPRPAYIRPRRGPYRAASSDRSAETGEPRQSSQRRGPLLPIPTA